MDYCAYSTGDGIILFEDHVVSSLYITENDLLTFVKRAGSERGDLRDQVGNWRGNIRYGLEEIVARAPQLF